MLSVLYREKIHIIACAVAASWAWARLLGAPIAIAELCLVGCIVAFVYSLNRFSDRVEDLINDPASLGHRNLYLVLGGSMLGIIAALVSLRSAVCTLIGAVVLGLGVFYSLPILGFRLKQHWLTKNTSSALGWSLLTVALPVLSRGLSAGPPFAVAFFYMISSVLMIEILWDIRDRAGDSQAGIKTLAALSESWAWIALSLVNVFSVVVFAVFFLTQRPPRAWLLLGGSASLLAVVCAASRWILPRLRRMSHHLVSAETALLIALGLVARGS